MRPPMQSSQMAMQKFTAAAWFRGMSSRNSDLIRATRK